MPMIQPASSLEIQPREALGPLTLSASLYSTLTTLLTHKPTFPRLNISFNSTDPVTNPIYIDLEANGVRLRFDGESQRLELIEVTEFGKIGLLYGDSNLRCSDLYLFANNSRHGPPTFRSVYKTFGPTSPGQLLPATSTSPATYILSYPGIAFKFPLPQDAPLQPSDKTLLNLLHKAEPPCSATSLVIFAGASWTEARAILGAARPCILAKRKNRESVNVSPPDEDDLLEFAEIVPAEKVLLHFKSGVIVDLTYGTFNAQDAITLLGPPSEIYTKSDNRLNIHNGHRHDEIDHTGPLSEGTLPPLLFFVSANPAIHILIAKRGSFRLLLQLLSTRIIVVIQSLLKPCFTKNPTPCEFTAIPRIPPL
jgi:isoleucyl-tRNA synthetase